MRLLSKSNFLHRKKVLKKPFFLIAVILVLSPIFYLGGFGVWLGNKIQLYHSFNANLSYDSYVDGMKSADFSLLESTANAFEQRAQQYHTPNGSILSVKFADETLTTPQYYGVLEDSDIWTGCYLGGEAFRWAVANRTNDIANQTQAEIAILRALDNFDVLLQITGVRGSLARYAVPGTEENKLLGLWNDDFVLVTEGPYTGWRYISFISKDQINGVLFGYGTIYNLVDNSTIREKIAQHIDWMVSYFEATHWLGINEDGTQSVRFVPFEPIPLRTPSGSRHILSCLNIARMINFTKYDPIYRKYAIDRNYAFTSNEDVTFNIVEAYFGININILPMYNQILLEDNPILQKIYFDDFNQSIYQIVKYHRNSFFNFIYLALANKSRIDEPNVVLDSLDSLQRFAESHYPNIQERIMNSEAPDYEDIVDPVSVSLYLEMEYLQESNYYIGRYLNIKIHAKDPLPVDRRNGGSFIWQRSPFQLDYPSEDLTVCQAGVDYLVAYWMGRYFKYIPNSVGVYN
jgi:hypothetical protein